MLAEKGTIRINEHTFMILVSEHASETDIRQACIGFGAITDREQDLSKIPSPCPVELTYSTEQRTGNRTVAFLRIDSTEEALTMGVVIPLEKFKREKPRRKKAHLNNNHQ